MAYPPPLQPNYYGQEPGAPPPSAGLAIASMVCGIVSLPMLCLWPLSIPLAIVAVVLGIIAKRQARRGIAGGVGMATAGIVCGTITLVVIGAFLALFIGVAILGSGASPPHAHVRHWP